MQQDINKDVFINIVQNTINDVSLNNQNLKYVIVTDVRFIHEFDYIRNHNGVTIKITKPNVTALNNIAEHDLDDEDNYTFNIDNDGTYDDLFQQVWDLVHEERVFTNQTQRLYTRDSVDNYLRLINDNTWQLCSPYPVSRIAHNDGAIGMIDLVGGPTIYVGEVIPGTRLIAQSIRIDDIGNKFIIETTSFE